MSSQAESNIAVIALGGTIAMTHASADTGVTPTLSASDLIAAVPGLDELAATITPQLGRARCPPERARIDRDVSRQHVEHLAYSVTVVTPLRPGRRPRPPCRSDPVSLWDLRCLDPAVPACLLPAPPCRPVPHGGE